MVKMKVLFYVVVFFSCIFLAPTVSAYDFTLSVYGNANMDDVLDDKDLEYLRGILSGTNEKTQFADANYDGIINEADITQIESIISSDPAILTLVDNQGITVQVDTPVKRNVNLFLGSVRPVVQLDSTDNIVGIGTITGFDKKLIFKAHPELKEIPEVGTGQEPNQEAILSVKPDAIYGGFFTSKEISQSLSQNTGIPFVYAAPKEVASFDKDDGAYETWRFIGLMQGNDDLKRAEELIHYSNEKIKVIEDVTSQVPEIEKPKVYFACYASPTMTSNYYQPIDIAGGINVAKDLPTGTSGWGGVDVSKEQIIEWNPDVILVHAGTKEDDGKHGSIDGILNDPALQSINAVKNKRVYGTKGWDTGWDPATGLCECYYLAKLFYPDLFKGLNVEKECNEILEEFYGVPGLYDWMLENCGNYVTWR
jgi:iron complex transport system substrate-binding protein